MALKCQAHLSRGGEHGKPCQRLRVDSDLAVVFRIVNTSMENALARVPLAVAESFYSWPDNSQLFERSGKCLLSFFVGKPSLFAFKEYKGNNSFKTSSEPW
jgi:hypothetical protein